MAETMMTRAKQISEERFSECAEIASKDGCLKQREGQYGKDFAIILNGHVMMTSTVNEDGDREYFSHM